MSVTPKVVGPAGLGLGVLAAGATLGWLGERFLVRRPPGGSLAVTAFDSLRSEPRVLTVDDGVELYVEIDDAPADATYAPITAFLVHGYALNLDCWYFQRQDLAGDVRMVFVDLRGHGRSGRGERSSHTIERLGMDLRELVEVVAPEGPIVLIGHSMGGMAIMALAEQAPELFETRVVGVGLLCTSASGLGGVLGLPRRVGGLVHKVAPTVVSALAKAPRLVERGRKSGTDLGHLLTRYYSFASRVPPGLVEFAAEMLAATPLEVVGSYLPSLNAHDRLDALPVMRGCATLVVGAVQDLMTPIEHTREIAEQLPDAEVEIVDPGGHMVLLEYPDEVTGWLRDLLVRSLEVAEQRVLV
jgi:pimeloyl-ACP methyl ester carboxylesterase